MSILPQSRYQSGVLTRVANSSGTYNLSVLRTTPAVSTNYKLYVWKEGDRPDIVAAKELGNPTLWWAIFDINPELIYPLGIPAGTVVRIPNSPVQGQGTLIQ